MNFHAPPPGSHSGVADYAERLHVALAKLHPPDVPLYHLGNNRLHADMYRKAQEAPGVIVLHDAVLHHFLLGALTREQYVAEFVYNYGEWSRHLGEDLWAQRSSSGLDPRYFQYPMLKRVLEQGRAVIVHNPAAAAIAREHGASNIQLIPHFFEAADPPDRAETARFRDRLHIPQGAFLFGIFGYLRETKRILQSVRAFKRLHAERPHTALLLAGESVSPDLTRLFAQEAEHAGIVRLPRLNERDLEIAVAAVDCCINLRYPGAGETSGIAIRAMGAGKPVILTDNVENSSWPAESCLRVSPGVAEETELLDHMILASEFPPVAAEIGNRAGRYIREHHSLAEAAQRYYEVLCAASSS